MFKDFADLADRQIAGDHLSPEGARAVLSASDTEVLGMVTAAARIRRAFFGDWVKVNCRVNLQSGLCPEDCAYCSQRVGSDAGMAIYSWLTPAEAAREAAAGIRAGASRICLAAGERAPDRCDVDRVAAVARLLKAEHPGVEICAFLGVLGDGQAIRLKAAGVDAYGHDINSGQPSHPETRSTPCGADRAAIDTARAAGLVACYGLTVSMGESDDDVIEKIFAVRDLGSESIPVDFPMPFDGAPPADTWLLNPMRCLRILTMARFACPAADIWMADGREMHLRTLQPLALHVANSLFLGDYEGTDAPAAKTDLEMIADAGCRVMPCRDDTGHHTLNEGPVLAAVRPRRVGSAAKRPTPFP